MGHFCILVSLRCSLTNLNSSRAGVARFRNIFDQILAPQSLFLLAKYMKWLPVPGEGSLSALGRAQQCREISLLQHDLAEARAASETNAGGI